MLIDGSNLTAAAIAVSGSAAWLAGSTTQADVAISPGAPAPSGIRNGYLPGAYLGMADFSLAETADTPHLACILDNAGGTRLAAVAPNQLLSLFGANLGPAAGVAAADLSTTSLAGVTVTFDGVPARLLYVSQSQINVVVPPPGDKKSLSMQVAYNGQASTPRQLPTVAMAPNLFAKVAPTSPRCPANATVPAGSPLPMAQNQDGTLNSCDHPAEPGSIVSFFLDGLGGAYIGGGSYVPLSIVTVPFNVRLGTWSAELENIPCSTI